MPSGESYEEKAAEFAKMIAQFKPSLTQIMSYLAVHNAGLESMLPGRQQCVWDAKLRATLT